MGQPLKLLGVAIGLGLGAGMAMGADGDQPVDGEGSLTFASKYVWHGINIVNAPVMQPEIVESRGNWSLSLWGSMELTNWNRPNYPSSPRGRWTELDVSLETGGGWREYGWTAGFVHYQYPGTGERSYGEWYVGVSREDLWGAPNLTVYAGSNSESGAYATFGLSPALSKSVDFEFEVTVGDSRCNRFLYDFDHPGLTDLHVSASTEREVGRGVRLSPSIHYSCFLNPDILRGEPRRTNLWGEVRFSTKF